MISYNLFLFNKNFTLSPHWFTWFCELIQYKMRMKQSNYFQTKILWYRCSKRQFWRPAFFSPFFWIFEHSGNLCFIFLLYHSSMALCKYFYRQCWNVPFGIYYMSSEIYILEIQIPHFFKMCFVINHVSVTLRCEIVTKMDY